MTTKAAFYDSIVAQQDKITRVLGTITSETIDILEDELAGIASTIKSDHFKEGLKYGHLAIVIPEGEYRTIIGDNEWEYNIPPDVGAYCPLARANTVNGERKQQEAEHAIKRNSQAEYIALDAALKHLVIHAMGEDALAPLKERYVGFGSSTTKAMIKHLRDKTAVKMTTLDKTTYKNEGYARPWDPTTNISTYFKRIDDFARSLKERRIDGHDDAEKMRIAVSMMWSSGVFTEDQMVDWEDKTDAEKSWTTAQAYFTTKWQSRQAFTKSTNKKGSRFNDQSLGAVTDEEIAEGEDAAMLLALMQENHRSQVEQMRDSNKLAMELMMKTMTEQMNTMIASMKENVPPTNPRNREGGGAGGGAGGGRGGGLGERQKKECPHCKKMVYHKPDNCTELEKNKDKRWVGWKSVNDK